MIQGSVGHFASRKSMILKNNLPRLALPVPKCYFHTPKERTWEFSLSVVFASEMKKKENNPSEIAI